MKHFKLFEEFHIEKIKLLKSPYEVVNKLFPDESLKGYKDTWLTTDIIIPYEKLIGTHRVCSIPPEKFGQNNLFYASMNHSDGQGNFVFGKMPEDTYILIASTKGKVAMKGLEEFFPKTITGGYGRNTYDLKLDIKNVSDIVKIEKSSLSSYTLSHAKDMTFTDYVLVTYKTTVSKNTEVTTDTIMELPEYKELMENSGYEMISNPSLLKKNTLAFGFPLVNLVPPKTLDEEWFRLVGTFPGNYLPVGWALYGTGYLRTIPVGNTGGEPAVAGKFEADTLEGWKVGIKMLQEKITKKKKTLAKKGIEMLTQAATKRVPYDEIIKLPNFKAMLDNTGLQVMNDKEKWASNYFMFKFPSDFVEGERDEVVEGEYIAIGLLIHGTGGIYLSQEWKGMNKNPSFHDIRQAAFDFQTVEGWKKGLDTAAQVWKNYKEEQEKNGVFLLTSAQERIDKRGKIAVRKFGM
jgi:hypothetical protein